MTPFERLRLLRALDTGRFGDAGVEEAVRTLLDRLHDAACVPSANDGHDCRAARRSNGWASRRSVRISEADRAPA